MNIKTLQTNLKSVGLYTGGIDGILGRNTKQGIREVQKILKSLGLYSNAIDGDIGRGTSRAIAEYQNTNNLQQVGYLSKETLKLMFKNKKITRSKYPRSERNLTKFYGRRGSNQAMLQLPYPMYLACGKGQKISRISFHKLVHDDMLKIFEDTLAHYGLTKIKELGLDQFGGCLNVRKIRGGNRWSTHSWGISVDLNPSMNRLRWRSPKAQFSGKDYLPFWEIVEKHGATSLGRIKNYDWMHFQFCGR